MKPNQASHVARRTLPRAAWYALALAAGAVALALGLAPMTILPAPALAGGMQELISRPVEQAPALDGVLDPVWQAAPATRVELRYGRLGGARAFDIELRAIHTKEAVYFAASWPGESPQPNATSESNKLIMHFDIEAPWEGAADTMCLAACHTTFVDDQGSGRYITAETIPPGRTDPLPVGGGWQDGQWTFEWGRPLVSPNPFDVQFANTGGHYRFFVKVVENEPDRADPASDNLLLLFESAK